MEKAAVYTRTGDNGTTSIIGDTRVDKDHPRVEAYGTLDELNAQLGLLAIAMGNHPQRATIEKIENNIMSVSCILATEKNVQCTVAINETALIEKEIDSIEAQLPPLTGFVLPSSVYASAQANVCRTVCRRAERRIVTLAKSCKIDNSILTYINRISDYLFSLARLLNEGEEKKWEKTCK